ncbi:MAG TPA: imidazole glycerol phosphate synthase subunit HisH [Rhizomicrobium sp.]|jgi:glutamine amidotransferase|nr:imidazole glycerol phosphate synthase subunit HisH [Rhizomicrobium sp.]
MRTALIDYGSGNIASAAKALGRATAGSRQEIVVTADPALVKSADRIVLPGVGAFADCMRGLSAVPGMIDALNETVLRNGRPFLGICVGMQLMATAGREFGIHPGLNWIEGDVVPIKPADPALKIPHMGWNEIEPVADHPIFVGLEPDANAYYVHSFEMKPADRATLLATTNYGGAVTAAIGRDNLVGTQFHPEKSQAVGLKILSNFMHWTP